MLQHTAGNRFLRFGVVSSEELQDGFPATVVELDRYDALIFGDGMCAVMTAWDTWRWQMHADVPMEDDRHERFWRSLLRWLADVD